jgi:hypothetical protein
MSVLLRMTVDNELPPSVIEILTPDLEIVERVMLAGGESIAVEVPSSDALLRVNLPSGRTFVLRNPGELSRLVSIPSGGREGSELPSLRRLREPLRLKDHTEAYDNYTGTGRDLPRRPKARIPTGLGSRVPLGRGSAELQFTGEQEPPVVKGSRTNFGRGVKWTIDGDAATSPFRINLHNADSLTAQLCLPSNLQTIELISSKFQGVGVHYKVRLKSTSAPADSIVGYLQRGDMYSAEAMTGWIDKARDLVAGKRKDPYGAAVGAYLLLRLKRFDQLHDWPRNLANWFPYLADGCVIWAWQSLWASNGETSREFETYIRRALDRGVPVFTEGLRLLLDALRLMGETGKQLLDRINMDLGEVFWSVPVTTSIPQTMVKSSTLPTSIDVAFCLNGSGWTGQHENVKG